MTRCTVIKHSPAETPRRGLAPRAHRLKHDLTPVPLRCPPPRYTKALATQVYQQQTTNPTPLVVTPLSPPKLQATSGADRFKSSCVLADAGEPSDVYQLEVCMACRSSRMCGLSVRSSMAYQIKHC